MIKYNNNRCICLKNKQKSCNIQCTNKRNIDSLYCKRHLNGQFKLVSDYNLIIIQGIIRGYLFRKELNLLFGPALKNVLLSFDNMDPISHESIWEMKDNIKINTCEIPKQLLFSYKDENNRIRVFNLQSLIKLKQYNKKHPITQDNLDSKLFVLLDKRITFMKKHNIWSNRLNETDKFTTNQTISNLITDICLKLSNQNIYISNISIESINKFKFCQLYNECASMLYHGDNNDFKDILKSNQYFINKINILNYNESELKILILQEIKNVLINDDLQQYINRISYIILGALMHVSLEINSTYNSNHIQLF